MKKKKKQLIGQSFSHQIGVYFTFKNKYKLTETYVTKHTHTHTKPQMLMTPRTKPKIFNYSTTQKLNHISLCNYMYNI